VIEVRRYLTRAGRNVFSEWFAGLADAHAKAKIRDRIDRLSQGNFGIANHWAEHCANSALIGGLAIDLLRHGWSNVRASAVCGGDKRKQASDIQRAREYLKDYRERTRIQ